MDNKKICFKCGLSKNLNKFYKRTDRINYSGQCIKCKQAYDREFYSKRPIYSKKASVEISKIRRKKIRKWLYNYLLNHPCVDCPEKDPVVLTFDHLKDKYMTISLMASTGYSIERIEKEIKKCEVVCANCHLRRTAKEFNWYKN